MSIAIDQAQAGDGKQEPRKPHASKRPLHRLGVVRRLQGISRRTVARRLGVEVHKVRAQEQGSADLLLSELYRWQEALEVPVSELLVEVGEELAGPVLRRAQLVRIMKSAMAIQEVIADDSARMRVQTLIDQLVEIMPELSDVGPWHSVGQRRRPDELGATANRRLTPEVFFDLME